MQKIEFGVFDSLQKGKVAIAPGGYNSVLKKTKLTEDKILLRLEDASNNEYGFTPSIDKLLFICNFNPCATVNVITKEVIEAN